MCDFFSWVVKDGQVGFFTAADRRRWWREVLEGEHWAGGDPDSHTTILDVKMGVPSREQALWEKRASYASEDWPEEARKQEKAIRRATPKCEECSPKLLGQLAQLPVDAHLLVRNDARYHPLCPKEVFGLPKEVKAKDLYHPEDRPFFQTPMRWTADEVAQKAADLKNRVVPWSNLLLDFCNPEDRDRLRILREVEEVPDVELVLALAWAQWGEQDV
jgi:hypothetical protein